VSLALHLRLRHAKALRLALLLAAAACSGGGSAGPIVGPPPPAQQCTFTNPLAAGADPWVVKQDGTYYYIQSRNDGIWIAKSNQLTGVIVAPATQVWSAPASGWNRTNVWAPELHHIDGHWYIYYAAGASGPPFLTQHAGVLQSERDDALGPYLDRGMLYTGDSVGTGAGNRWSIDLTVGSINGQRYAVWSGWRQDALTDRTPQQLYIARMENPWTISMNRVELSAPVESWERGTELDLQEGPEFLEHDGSTFVVYSTRESWLKDYRLGQLRLNSATADPLTPGNWTKSGPVFAGNAAVFGVGHASFTTSPDDAQSWVVYHSKVSETPGWDRVVRMQSFTWDATGAPAFGQPWPAGQKAPRPSGECP
jgi:GH43 family beta-xylosidase